MNSIYVALTRVKNSRDIRTLSEENWFIKNSRDIRTLSEENWFNIVLIHVISKLSLYKKNLEFCLNLVIIFLKTLTKLSILRLGEKKN